MKAMAPHSGPEEMMDAAQHRHQQRIAGMLPAEVVGVGALEHERQQPARVADEAAHEHERDELQPEGVVAEALRALLVVAHRLQACGRTANGRCATAAHMPDRHGRRR